MRYFIFYSCEHKFTTFFITAAFYLNSGVRMIYSDSIIETPQNTQSIYKALSDYEGYQNG